VPRDEAAGIFAFIKTILFILSTVVIWLSFFWYRISLFRRGSIQLLGGNNRSGISSASNFHDVDKTNKTNITNDFLMSDNITVNAANMSALTQNYRRSPFANNMVATQSFANNSD
jgi:hypothetical protein